MSSGSQVLSSFDAINDAVELFVRTSLKPLQSTSGSFKTCDYGPCKVEPLRRRYMRFQDPVDKSAYRRVDDDIKKIIYETKSSFSAKVS